MKTLYIVSGGIASGKSTFASKIFTSDYFKEIEFVSADVYARTLFNVSCDIKFNHKLAKKYMAYKQKKLIAKNVDFVWEVVPSKTEKLDFIHECKTKHNYDIVIFFVGTANINLNLARSSHRVNQGAEPVYVDKIRSRYQICMNNLFYLFTLASKMYIFDNSDELKLLACKDGSTLYVFNKGVGWLNDYLIKKL